MKSVYKSLKIRKGDEYKKDSFTPFNSDMGGDKGWRRQLFFRDLVNDGRNFTSFENNSSIDYGWLETDNFNSLYNTGRSFSVLNSDGSGDFGWEEGTFEFSNILPNFSEIESWGFNDTLSSKHNSFPTSVPNGASYVNGYEGKAIQFNGTNQYLQIDISQTNYDRFTICFWVKMPVSGQSILQWANELSSSTPFLLFGYTNTTVTTASLYANNAYIINNVNLPRNEWVFISIRRDNTDWILNSNDNEYEFTGPRGIRPGPTLYFGNGYWDYSSAVIDDLRIFNTAITNETLHLVRFGYWNPSEIQTELWLDASDLNTIEKDGSNLVGQWGDKSGNNRHATASGTNSPIWSNNKLVFNGSSNRMNLSLNLTSTMTVVEVFGRSASGIKSVCIGGSASNSPPYGVQWWNDNIMYSGLGSSLYLTHGSSSTNTGEFISGLRRKSTHTDLFSQGTEIGTELANLTLTSAEFVYIGARASDYHNGTILEMIVINSDVSDGMRQKIEGYLAHKWDTINGDSYFKNSLPINHPYKSAPPSNDPTS